ncbi:unnamed protein product [Ambrosiozyma monospora]|uniref:Unnamed protein product n=1 Tax=Ambrosiozyma monospora TaxID=43982 RepID=A0ACB5T9Z9_AMBMO|nr:unnamed protein product [Ambrosiozyma monospora]
MGNQNVCSITLFIGAIPVSGPIRIKGGKGNSIADVDVVESGTDIGSLTLPNKLIFLLRFPLINETPIKSPFCKALMYLVQMSS